MADNSIGVILFILFALCVGVWTIFRNMVEITLGDVVGNTAYMFSPFNIIPFSLLFIALTATVDWPYFPTSPIVTIWTLLMFRYGYLTLTTDPQTILYTLGGVIAYITIGFIWVKRVKWHLILHDKKYENQIRNAKSSQVFMTKMFSKLYPHFLYWPFSVMNELFSNLGFKAYEIMMTMWSGYFTASFEKRKRELEN